MNHEKPFLYNVFQLKFRQVYSVVLLLIYPALGLLCCKAVESRGAVRLWACPAVDLSCCVSVLLCVSACCEFVLLCVRHPVDPFCCKGCLSVLVLLWICSAVDLSWRRIVLLWICPTVYVSFWRGVLQRSYLPWVFPAEDLFCCRSILMWIILQWARNLVDRAFYGSILL